MTWKPRVLGVRFGGLVLIAIIGASLSGCVSVGVVRVKGVPPGSDGVEGVVVVPTGDGAVEISICDTPKSKKAGVPTARPIRIDLFSLEQGLEKAVESVPSPTLSKQDLAAGTYRVRVREAASVAHNPNGPSSRRTFECGRARSRGWKSS
jgi:hypothetical protein